METGYTALGFRRCDAMTDPRLQSVHLDADPRREDFRRARNRVEGAIGEKTLLGDLDSTPIGPKDKTFAGTSGSSFGIPNTSCWLLIHGRQIVLKIGLNSVGRLPDNDVILEDDTVSRRHCAIVVHSNMSIELYDIASKNGTRINGRKFTGSTWLTDGDEITVGSRKVVFVMRSGAATLDAPPHSAQSSSEMTHVA